MSEQRLASSTTLTDRDLLGVLWRALASRRMTAALLISLAVAALFALFLVPQRPASTAGAGEMARWISDAQTRFGPAYETLLALGLLNVRSSIGFRLLLGLGGLMLAVRLVDGAAKVVATCRDREVLRPESFYRELHDAEQWESSVSRSDLAGRLENKLAWPFWMVWDRWKITPRRENVGSVSHLQQDLLTCRRAASLGVLLGLLLVLGGLGLDARLGWREEGLMLVPGGMTTLEARPDVSLRLDGVEDGGGRLVSRITLERAGNSPLVGEATYGRPYTTGGLTVYQRDVGPLLRLSAEGAAEQGASAPIALQDASLAQEPAEEIRLIFTESRAERYVVMPYIQKIVRLVLYRRGESWDPEQDELLIEVYAANSEMPEVQDSLVGSGSVKLGDIVYRFDWRRYAVLDVVRSSAHGWVRMGLGLALLGLVAVLLIPPLRLWVRVLEKGECCTIELVGEMPGEPDGVLEASLEVWRRRLREEIEGG